MSALTQTEIVARNHRRAVMFFWGLLLGATTVSLLGNIAHAVLPYLPTVFIQIGPPTPTTSCGTSRKASGCPNTTCNPIYHHLRESIEAHLSIVVAAMAVGHYIET
jgi:hypothetical protein